MSELYKNCFDKHGIKWFDWLWLWAVPTYKVYEGDSVYFFKKAFGKIYAVGEGKA